MTGFLPGPFATLSIFALREERRSTLLIAMEPRIYRFGDYEFAADGELRRHGLRVKLQQQPLHILLLLLERPSEVVTREELRTMLWPANTYVEFDAGLNTAMRRLRQSLQTSSP